MAEIARLTGEGVTADHFAKAKEALVKRNEVSMQRRPHWIASLAYPYFNDRPLTEIIEEKELTESITAEDLKAVFAALDKPAIAVLLPKK